MRFIHTSDWHLGRQLHGKRLIEDQAYVLDRLVELVKDVRPDAVVISGDVYDRSLPSTDAVQLLDDVLSRLVVGLGVPVVAIAGNHDSPARLQFASKMLQERGLVLSGFPTAAVVSMCVADNHGPVRIYAIPFAEPALVREALETNEIQDHQDALDALVARIRLSRPRNERSVLLAHAFVRGASQTDSERPLSLGGADLVDTTCFDGFDYVALGHLHRPQKAGSDHIQYAGSLFKYSFSEVNDVKGVNLVEMDRDGRCTVERVQLQTIRDVRRIEGLMSDLLRGPAHGENPEDYLLISLYDTGAILDAMARLREVYPNVLHLERPCPALGEGSPGPVGDHRKRTDADLFADFFIQVTGEPITEEQAAAYESVVQGLRNQEGEALCPRKQSVFDRDTVPALQSRAE